MQRHSLGGVDEGSTSLSSPGYPQQQMYDPSQSAPTGPPGMGHPHPPSGPGAYYPYPGDPGSNWSSFPPPPHQDYGHPQHPPPPPPPGWYGAPPGVAGPSASTSYYPPSQSSSPYPGQNGHFPRGSFSGPSDYPALPQPPLQSGLASLQRDINIGEGSARDRNGVAGPSGSVAAAAPAAGLGAATAGKKKRRKQGDRDGSAGSAADAADKEKRTKTGRACDACRTKKIRCDILPASESISDDSPICAHCKQYNLECTFFLPITETRFKKKKTAGESEGSPAVGGSSNTQAASPARAPPEVPGRIEGPTSLSFLLHTSLPASASEAYDLRYHNSWEVSEDGNGLIRVKAPPSGNSARNVDGAGVSGPGTGSGGGGTEDPSRGHTKLNRPILNAHTISLLVNAYFDHLAHLFPIISRSEFAAKQNPPPLLLYSICGVGATRRQFPREIFAGVRGVINGLLRSNDILSDARIENVQALLVLAQVGDLHAQPTAATASASLMRTGSAIRMAQDLGLHRESHLRAQTPQDLAYVELRRRIWATCVIMDRWYGAALGIPLHVDLLDCDVLLPAGYDIILDQDPSSWPIEPSFVALSEHLKLSILVGRVLKIVYSPTGLKHATDEQLYSILEDMWAWKENLPEGLQYAGPGSSFAAGLLHLAYATLHFLLWRPFMRITYICPPHLKFALETMHWSQMTEWAGEALEWLHRNGEALDTVFIYAYTATSCALVQYHTWVRRREPGSLESLKQIRETATAWEAAVQPDQMSIRRKTCETMTLLYEAALKTNPEDERPPRINPTAGVQLRPDVGKAVWVADASKPYGGIWVAQDDEEKKDSGLQENSVVTQEHMGKERPPPELESTHPAIRARAMSRLRGTDSAAGSQGRLPGEGSESGSRRSGTGGSGASAEASAVDDGDGDGVGGEMNGVAERDFGAGIPHPHPSGQNFQGGDRDGSLDFANVNGNQGTASGPGATTQDQPTYSTHGFNQAGQNQNQADPTQMQILRDMQMAGSNVNPQMNYGGLDLTGGNNAIMGMGFTAEPNAGCGTFDPGVLDSLPANGFNFDQWNTWFSNIDRMVPPQDAGLGLGMGRQHQQHQQQQQEGDGGRQYSGEEQGIKWE